MDNYQTLNLRMGVFGFEFCSSSGLLMTLEHHAAQIWFFAVKQLSTYISITQFLGVMFLGSRKIFNSGRIYSNRGPPRAIEGAFCFQQKKL